VKLGREHIRHYSTTMTVGYDCDKTVRQAYFTLLLEKERERESVWCVNLLTSTSTIKDK
jgi:hypothetical protein